jgi:putative transposase
MNPKVARLGLPNGGKGVFARNIEPAEGIQALPHFDTVFAQFLKLVPRHDFNRLAREHCRGGEPRSMTRWSQFVAMTVGHVTGRASLRDTISTIGAQGARLYHLGIRKVARSSLARVNGEQPCSLYESLFQRLATRCQALAPRHGFRFKNKLYSMDATLIDLSLTVFPWAKYALGKGAMKLHMGLDHDGLIPAFAVVTESRVMEQRVARQIALPKGSIVVVDRGYSEFAWFRNLDDQGVFFVTRRRANTIFEVVEEHRSAAGKGVTSDHTVRFVGDKARKSGIGLLRLVTFDCPDTGKRYEFLTNIRHLTAATIAAIYKDRWQIELFFKFLKQNLKLKGFYGTSKNAVLTQIWIALCVALLVAYLKFASMLDLSFQKILRLLDTNLFLRRDLRALLEGRPPDPPRHHSDQGVLAL